MKLKVLDGCHHELIMTQGRAKLALNGKLQTVKSCFIDCIIELTLSFFASVNSSSFFIISTTFPFRPPSLVFAALTKEVFDYYA
jgi:hypothetical protein